MLGECPRDRGDPGPRPTYKPVAGIMIKAPVTLRLRGPVGQRLDAQREAIL